MDAALGHAISMVWLLDVLDDWEGTVEFNMFYPDGIIQAFQVPLLSFRNYPNETLRNFIVLGRQQKAKVSIGPNLRWGVAPKAVGGLTYDGFGTKQHITQCSAFFQDADLGDVLVPLEELIAYRPQPTMIVQSSVVGKYHMYWKLSAPLMTDDAEVVERYEGVQRGIANFFGFHPMNIRQTMGLPGTRNHKYADAPLRKVVFLNPQNIYSDWADFPSAVARASHHDYGDIEVVHDGKIPADAITQLQNPVGRHGGRNNAVFAVATWLRDLAFSQAEVERFILDQCAVIGHYHNYPQKDILIAVRSAFRR